MNTWRCKCGKAEYFGSGMTPKDCEDCEDCGTNFRQEPTAPHKLEMRYNEKTGKPDHQICTECYEKVSL